MHGIKIGKTELKYGILLAPMAGVTDHAYRTVCKRHGAEYMISEMVSAKAIHFGDKDTDILARITEEEQPMVVQIFGSEPEIMAEAAKFLSDKEERPAAIDINMGCPVRKIVNNGEGSALMREPEKAGLIVRAVSEATDLPVTVKMRAGIGGVINAPELARACEEAGAKMITVHGRTREQMYAPSVDLGIIKEVKKAVRIPVVGNGDISSASDAREMLEKTGCDGIMLGRGTMGNPWLFDEIISLFEGKPFTPPTPEEKIKAAEKHAEMLIADKGRTGVLEARRHISYYLKGIRSSASARGKLNTAENFDEMKRILSDLLEKIGKEGTV